MVQTLGAHPRTGICVAWRRIIHLTTTVFALVAGSHPGLAQDTETPAFEVLLPGIVVTADRRERDVFRTPIGVTVLDPAELTAAGSALDPIGEIARRTPNANFVNGGAPGQNFISIRGIGPFGEPFNSLDTTVGFFVDGVPTTLLGFEGQALDLRRIDVLKGPQGASFGRSTLGGAVNFITRTPEAGQRPDIRLELGADGHVFTEASGTVASQDNRHGARVALRHARFGGDINAPFLGKTLNGNDLYSARGSIELSAGERLKVTASGLYNRNDGDQPIFVLRDAPGFPVSGSDIRPDSNRENRFLTVRSEYDGGGFRIVSLTNLQRNEIAVLTDLTDSLVFANNTGLPGEVFDNPAIDTSKSSQRENVFFQEFRLLSPEAARIDWSLGASLYSIDYSSRIRLSRDVPVPFPPGGAVTIDRTTDADIQSHTAALFASLSAPLSDRFEVSASARIAQDDQDFSGLDLTGPSGPFQVAVADRASAEEVYWTGRAGIVFRPDQSHALYANVARGHSSEGFQRTAVPTRVFPSGSSFAYEAGYRTRLFGGRLDLDATVFYNDVKSAPFAELVDLQNLLFGIRTQDYETYGLEVQARAKPISDLEVFATLGVQEARRGRTDSSDPAVLTASRVPGVPDTTASAGFSWRPSLEGKGLKGRLHIGADAQYVGGRAGNLRNTISLDEYVVVNGRFGWSPTANSEVYAFGRNLTDERFEASGFSFPPRSEGVVAGTGRVFGAGIRVRF
ncbi:MAG: TonB-dependent receptor [Pseudomonadota bacterium]